MHLVVLGRVAFTGRKHTHVSVFRGWVEALMERSRSTCALVAILA